MFLAATLDYYNSLARGIPDVLLRHLYN